MHDYIYQQLAKERAVTLREEAEAHRSGKQALTRRSERKARKPHGVRRSARVAH